MRQVQEVTYVDDLTGDEYTVTAASPADIDTLAARFGVQLMMFTVQDGFELTSDDGMPQTGILALTCGACAKAITLNTQCKKFFSSDNTCPIYGESTNRDHTHPAADMRTVLRLCHLHATDPQFVESHLAWWRAYGQF